MPTGTYRIQFTNHEQEEVLIDIINTKSAGDLVNLVGTGFSKRTVDNNENKFTPIRGIECTIKFMSSSLARIQNFIGLVDEWYVVATVAGADVFQGYLITEDLQQAYFDDPTEIVLTATDGLGGLKGYTLEDTGVNPKGYYTIAEIVALCLSKTVLGLEFWVSWNLRRQTSSAHWFNDIYTNAKSYEEEINVSQDCYSVLEKILSMSAFIHQSDGRWYIMSVDEMESGLNTFYKYDNTGTLVVGSNPASILYVASIGSSQVIKFSQEDQLIRFRREQNFTKTIYHYEYPSEIVDNQNFERGAFNGVVVPPAGYTAYNLDDWTKRRNFPDAGGATITPLILRKFDANGYEIERFASIPGVNTAGNTDYIESNPIPIIIQDKFSVSFDFRFPSNISGSGMVTDIIGYVYLKSGVTTYNLQNDGTWVLGTGFTITHQWNRGTTDESKWMTVSVEADPAPISGNVYVCLLKSSQFGNTTDTYFSNLNFDYIPYINGTYRRYNGQYNKTYTDLNKNPNIEEEVYLSDSPKPLFKGSLFYFDSPSGTFPLASMFFNSWRTPTPASGDHYTFSKLQNIGVWNQYKRAVRVFEGSLQGLRSSTGVPDCVWKYSLTDANVNTTGKIFMCVGFDQDFYSCEWKGTFAETYDSTEGKVFDDDFEFKYIEQ